MMPTFTHYFMGPLVASFYQRYPNITLDIQELAQDRMETLLLNDELDIGIAFDGSDSRDIVSQPLLSETWRWWLAALILWRRPVVWR